MAKGIFHSFSNAVSRGAGNPVTFSVATGLIVLWAVSGPFFSFSETWQLVVNTATTIITFLMVFVLQHTQNRDSQAVQAKLDDLIVATNNADNRFVGAENLTGQELHALRKLISERVRRDQDTLAEIEERVGSRKPEDAR